MPNVTMFSTVRHIVLHVRSFVGLANKKHHIRKRQRKRGDMPKKDIPVPTAKPTEERVKEAIELVQKMKDFGLSETSVGFKETKQRLNNWIRNGEGFTGKIHFEEYGRKGELILPTRNGCISSMKLLAPK
jgi:hypothetical protein